MSKRTTLPEDLLIDILVRIPAGKLGKFRHVSKFFRRLIDSPKFVQEHHDRWIKTRPRLIIQGSDEEASITFNTEFLVDYDSSTAYPFIIPANMTDYKEIVVYLGCCRGILCYKIIKQIPIGKKVRLAFWNPLTGACRRSVGHDDAVLKPGSGLTGSCKFFLGYNAVTDDLKVMMMTCYRRYGDDQVLYAYDVYSSKTDSWTRVEAAGLIFSKFYYDSSHVFVEGTNSVHMLVLDDALRILAFDFASEKFSLKVPLPHQCSRCLMDEVCCIAEVKEQVGLVCLDGCLCFYRNSSRDRLEVWMMKEYGVEQSWTRVFSLKPSHEHHFYKKLVPRAFVDYKGRRKLLVSSTTPMMACMYLCDGKEEEEKEEVKEIFHNLKQHLRWTYLKAQHFEYTATCRQP